MQKFGFQVKLSIAFITLLVFVLIVTTLFIYQKAVMQQREELRSKILSLAKLSTMLIDGDKLIQIKPQIESENTVSYREIREVLKKIRDTDLLIDDVYTMVKTDKENIWMFLVGAGDRKGISTYCGELYDVSRYPQMQVAFKGPSVDKELTVDKWGVWLSGYAPIYNSRKEAVAIVGLDVSAQSIRQMQLLLAKRFFGILILGIIFSLLLGWSVARGVTGPLRNLILGIREVGRGNLAQKVKIKSRDEIEELANAFNKMTEGLQEAQSKLEKHYLDTIHSLAQAMEAKDFYLRGHSERVRRYALDIAKALRLSSENSKLLQDLCILHDIGKIGIPEKILAKSDSLSQEEWQIVKTHPTIGEEILRHIEFLRPGLSIVRDHHERPDGKGYPHALKSDEISLLAAIVAVADAYDAMTSARPYRKPFTEKEAISILKENAGSQFNPDIVKVFIESLK